MAVLTILAALLRVYELGTKPLWIDEAYSLDRARAPLTALWTDLIADHLPAYFAMVWAAYHVFGGAEWVLRLPSALLSASVPIALVLIGRELHQPRAGALAALLYALSPFVIFWSQEAKPEAAAVAVASWSTYQLLAARRRRGSKVRWAAYAVTSLVGLYTFYYYTFVFVSHSIAVTYACIRGRRLRALVRWLAAQCVLLVLFLPWPLTHLVGHVDDAGFPFMGVRSWNGLLLDFIIGPLGGDTGDRGNLIGAPLATVAGGFLALMAVFGIIRFGRRTNYSFEWAVILAWGSALLAGAFCVQLVIAAHQAYYLLPAVPAALLFAGIGLEPIIDSIPRIRFTHAAAAGLAGILTVPWVAMDVSLYDHAATQHAGWRDASAYFLSHRETGEILVADPAWQASTLAYYMPDASLVAAPERPPAGSLSCLTDALRAGVHGVWIATTTLAHSPEMVAPTLGSIAKLSTPATERGGVRLVHYAFLPGVSLGPGATGWGDFLVQAGSGVATLDTPGALRFASLCESAQRDLDVRTTIQPDQWPSAGNELVDVLGRWTAPDTAYLLRIRLDAAGAVWVQVGRWMRTMAQPLGGEVLVARQDVSRPPEPVALRLQVRGTAPSLIRAKVWLADRPEPVGWSSSMTDDTSELQGAGGVAIQAFVSAHATNTPIHVRFDGIQAAESS
jgi:dolichyl-phosphate-mannose-protein mannosyltransferase